MEANKKIIVRAVYGCTTKTFRKVIRITYDAGCVLGCTICGAKVKEVSIDKVSDISKIINAGLQVDLHLWYRAGNDTKVVKMRTEFSNKFEIVKQGAGFFTNEEAFVWLQESPKYLDTIYIENPEKHQIAVQIEYTIKAEIIGDTELNVKVFET